MKRKSRSFIVPSLTMFFFAYGVVSVYRDWLAGPIKMAFEYIDGIGTVFWVCLLVAGVVVWVADRVARKGEQEGKL